MRPLTVNQMEVIQGGKMFGSTTTCTNTSYFDPEMGIYRPSCIVETTSYFFWIVTSVGEGVQDGQKYGTCSYNGY
jgi:hypothetical protein